MKTAIRWLAATMALALGGCRTMFGGQRSELVTDQSAGLNGGFEVVRSGVPVNWLVYSPRTIPTGEYQLVADTSEFKGGKQSLRFDVRSCASTGGWLSPGLSKEVGAAAGTTYRVGFWARNDGAEFVAKVGGITATEGKYETIVKSRDAMPTWRYFEHDYTMPAGFTSLRFEVNVVQPGTFWIDEVTIAAVK
jgi:hypothetical protein